MRRFINVRYTPFFEGDDGSGGGGGGEGDDKSKITVTMTQAELDALIGREKGRATKKFADYDELKAERDRLKAEEDTRKSAELTETQRLQADKENAERDTATAKDDAKKAKESADRRVIDAEIRSIARSLNAADANDVLALVSKAGVEIDDEGNVTGVEEAVKALKEAKPHLFKAPVGADASGGGNPAGNPNKSELAAKEKELAETKQAALKDTSLRGRVTALYQEVLALRAKK